MIKKIFENINITDAGAKGMSIGKAPDGKVIFVPYAVPDDIADIRIIKKKSKYYEGVIDKIIYPSKKREIPKCSHFGTCGGCKWQNMDYENQLFFKQKEIQDNLKRIGKIEHPINNIIPAKDIFFYRNKMEYGFSNNRWVTDKEIESGKEIFDRNASGFHVPGKWDKILNIEKCYLQNDISNQIRNFIKDFGIKNNYSFYDLRKNEGFLRNMMIRISSINQVMVLIQFGENDKEKIHSLLSVLYKNFPQIDSLLYTVNTKVNDTIYDQNIILFKGNDFIEEEMENFKFRITAKSFYQTNSKQAYELYKIIRNIAKINSNDIVYDLYTGTGTIALFNSKQAKKIIGIESVPEAINDARFNAQNNNITNTHFFVGDIKDILNNNFLKVNGIPNIIITDPPRDGMHKNVIEKIIEIKAKKIIYVSCNSATQARDLEFLLPFYNIIEIQPIDMFPHTHHVENVVLLELK